MEKKSTGLSLLSICNFEPICSTKFKSTWSATSFFHWLFVGAFRNLGSIFLVGGSMSSFWLLTQLLHLTNIEHNPSQQNLMAAHFHLRKQGRSGCYHPNFCSFSSKLGLSSDHLITQLSRENFTGKMDFPTVILQRIGSKSPRTLCYYPPGIQIFYLSLAGKLWKVFEFWSLRKCMEKGDTEEAWSFRTEKIVTSKNSEKILKEETAMHKRYWKLYHNFC